MHFHAPRLNALRGGDKSDDTPALENEREVLMRRACARALSPRSFSLLEHSFQPTPSPLCGLASWPLLGACSMYLGELFLQFLTWPLSSWQLFSRVSHNNSLHMDGELLATVPLPRSFGRHCQ